MLSIFMGKYIEDLTLTTGTRTSWLVSRTMSNATEVQSQRGRMQGPITSRIPL